VGSQTGNFFFRQFFIALHQNLARRFIHNVRRCNAPNQILRFNSNGFHTARFQLANDGMGKLAAGFNQHFTIRGNNIRFGPLQC